MSAATKIPDRFKDKKFKFPFDDDVIVMAEEHYKNGRLRIQFYAPGEPFATLTMNLVEDDPGNDAFFVKTFSENEPLIPVLLASGVFIDVKHPRDTAWKFSRGRLVTFEHGTAFEDEIVQTEAQKEGVPARNVALGEVAWRLNAHGDNTIGFELGPRHQVPPVCPYCQAVSEYVGGDVVYPHRQDLADKRFWICRPCNAYVGCHDGTPEPLGRLANAELRSAKMRAHAAFDPIWKTGRMKRGAAYRWLADKLGIDFEECHIGMFDLEQCRKVVALAEEELRA